MSDKPISPDISEEELRKFASRMQYVAQASGLVEGAEQLGRKLAGLSYNIDKTAGFWNDMGQNLRGNVQDAWGAIKSTGRGIAQANDAIGRGAQNVAGGLGSMARGAGQGFMTNVNAVKGIPAAVAGAGGEFARGVMGQGSPGGGTGGPAGSAHGRPAAPVAPPAAAAPGPAGNPGVAGGGGRGPQGGAGAPPPAAPVAPTHPHHQRRPAAPAAPAGAPPAAAAPAGNYSDGSWMKPPAPAPDMTSAATGQPAYGGGAPQPSAAAPAPAQPSSGGSAWQNASKGFEAAAPKFNFDSFKSNEGFPSRPPGKGPA